MVCGSVEPTHKSPVSFLYPGLEKKANLTKKARKSRAKTIAISRFSKVSLIAISPLETLIQIVLK